MTNTRTDMEGWAAPPAPVVASGLSAVDFYTTCVLDADVQSTWQAVRCWAESPWLKGDAELAFRVLKLGGGPTAEIGTLRVFCLGSSQMFEQLTALDDEERLVRWKLISHPQTVSPFSSASFVNYVASIRLLPVTVGGRSFVEWKGKFFTEPQNAQQMRATLESWCLSGFKNLQAYMLSKQHLQQQTSMPTLSPRGSVISQPEFTFPSQPTAAAASYAAARSTFLPKRASQKPHWQRFAGSLAQDGGVPIVHGPDSASSLYGSQDGHTKASRLHPSQADGLGPALSEGGPASDSGIPQGMMHPCDWIPGSQQQADLMTQRRVWQSTFGKHGSTSSSSQTAAQLAKSDISFSQPSDSRSSSWNSQKQEQATQTAAAKESGSRQHLPKGTVTNGLQQTAGSAYSPDVMTESSSNSRDSDQPAPQSGRHSLSTPSKQPQKLDAAMLKRHEAKEAPAEKTSSPMAPQVDEALMHRLAQHLQASWNERETNEARSSFEEAAAQLEERHRQLHKARRSTATDLSSKSPFSSPFAATYKSPFLNNAG